MESDTRDTQSTNDHSNYKKFSTFPLCSSALNELVTDFKRLLINTLLETYIDVDPIIVLYNWLNAMKHRCLEDKKCCATKTPDSVCFKMLSISNIIHLSLCKAIYGTVDLKTGLQICDNMLHDTEKDISERDEKANENADLVKEVLTGITFEQAATVEYVVAPFFKARSKKSKQKSELQSKNADNTGSAAQGSEPGLKTNEKSNVEEGACATKTAINSPSKPSIQISIDEHNRSCLQDAMINPYRNEVHTSVKQNNPMTNEKETLSGDITGAETSFVDSNNTRNDTSCTFDPLNTSDNNEDHNLSSEPSTIKTNGLGVRKHNNNNNDNSNNNSNNNDDNNNNDIFRNLTSQTDERSVSNLTNPAINQSDNQSFEPLMCIINKLSRGESVPPQVSMQYEMLRFCTLRSFPKENKPYITRLAQAGFYYANNYDEVVCYCCAQRKRNWEEHDIPMDVHRQLNPNCKFLLRNSEVNVPIKTDESFIGILTSLHGASNMRSASGDTTRENSQPPNREVASATSNTSETIVLSSNKHSNHSTIGSIISNQNEVQRDAFVSSLQQSSASNRYPRGHFVQASAPKPLDYERRQQTASNKAFEPLNGGPGRFPTRSRDFGTPQTALPKHPTYAIRTVRMSSFSDCGDIVVSPESLAEAGFYYAGFGDCVRCFQCGVGLRHWSVEDDPWIEHSRWSKECSYVRQMRGQEFVNLVQKAGQYQSDQQTNETTQNGIVAGSNQGATGMNEVETLLHKNSAQSVLEMGYHPDLIRRAISAVLEEKGREAVSASNLMEKIFEIEETPSENAVEQVEMLEVSNHIINDTASSKLQSEPSTPQTEKKESQRFAETTRGELQSAAKTENTEPCSHASRSVQLASAQSGSINSTRVSKRSQLLEKKKLKEENERLKQQSVCTKCRINEVCIVFLPCGHLVTCETCAPTIKYCTVQSCGKYIKDTLSRKEISFESNGGKLAEKTSSGR